MTNTDTDDVSAGTAALMLGVNPRTIIRWVDDGKLTVARWTDGGHRRFRRSDVERIAAERGAA